MSLFEVVIRAKYDNPFGRITSSNPSLRMYQWCNDKHDIIELVLQKQDDYDAIRKDFAKAVEVVDEIHNGANVHVITRMCACGGPGTVIQHLSGPDILIIPPIAYENGWEYFRLIGFRHETLRNILAKLRDEKFNVEILRKVPFDGYIASSLTLTTDALFSDLTDKQMDALLTAYRYGYFRFPRGADLQTIASKVEAGRTTFLEHLKKAENKIINALVPYIQLFRQIPLERKDTMSLVSDII
ncbi:MAG: helix-turn-helix domain-containing protein [Candidatus Thorarchaeota archaeon]